MLSSLSSLAATLSRRRREGAAAVTAASSAAFASVLFRTLSSSSPAAAEASPSSPAPSPSSSSSAAAVAKGVNYLKSGSDPVIASPLPEWLPEVSAAPPTAFELRRALEQSREQQEEGGGGGGEGGEESFSSKGSSLTGSLGARGTKQLLKLEARARIKERNSVKAKK